MAIAKFPKEDDEIDVIGWEAVALALAKKAGIEIPLNRLEPVGCKRILLSRRFDRNGEMRIPFLSAMSALGAKDNEMHSYLEIADAIRQITAHPQEDLKALWRRIVFNVMISNGDDHLRNYAFLYKNGDGWRLSPAYDLNPTPLDIRPRVLSTAIDANDPSASIPLALSVASYFGLDDFEAQKIVREISQAVCGWRQEAEKARIRRKEIDRMASAFALGELS